MIPEEGYREAEQRITEAQRLRTIGLYLSNLQLTKIPPQIAQLSNLQILHLDKNKIVEIPDAITQLSNLQYLSLENNQVVEIPDAIAKLSKLKNLYLHKNQIVEIPKEIGQLFNLKKLYLNHNKIVEIPEEIAQLDNLQLLNLNNNKIVKIPEEIAQLDNLQKLKLSDNKIVEIPDAIIQLSNLQQLFLYNNQIVEIPDVIAQLSNLQKLNLDNNPLNPTLAAVYKQGLPELKNYLLERAKSQITLNEGKLILVGEGAVGKSCLLGALRGDEWIEGRSKTHGIEIKPCQFTHNQTEITLNGWDFGGQTIYRPTHQLFFSAPAVYLVVWNPRMGIHQGCVEYWITLVIRRAPQAKILVIATHKNPNQSQPDIPSQQLIEKFGQNTLINFFFINSKPEEETGIEELKNKIAEVAYHWVHPT